MNNRLLALLCLLQILSLGGCSKTSIQKFPEASVLVSPEQELILSDLPIPFGFRLINYKEYPPLIYCRYEGTLDPKKIESFIVQDIERNGWRLENLATQELQSYILTKANRTALLMLEQKKHKNILHINLKN